MLKVAVLLLLLLFFFFGKLQYINQTGTNKAKASSSQTEAKLAGRLPGSSVSDKSIASFSYYSKPYYTGPHHTFILTIDLTIILRQEARSKQYMSC